MSHTNHCQNCYTLLVDYYDGKNIFESHYELSCDLLLCIRCHNDFKFIEK